MLTATGLVSAVATAVVVATGHLIIAIFLLTLTGLHDLLDGPVAKAAGTSSLRGAFFDSVVDRVADAVLMGGVSWYLVSHHRGHLVLLPLAVSGVTSLVSYQRAKAEALGIGGATGGLMERAERMILLGRRVPQPGMLVPVLWVLLGLTSATAVGRFVRVWRAAEGPSPGGRRARSAGRAGARDGSTPAGGPGARRGQRASGRAAGASPAGRWRTRRREAPLASRSGRLRRAGNRRVRVGRSSSGDPLS